MITVELERASGEPRYFNGYVFDFRFLHSDGGYAAYGMTLRPWLAFLSRRTDNYLLHDQTTRQALEAIFADYAEKDVEFHITDSGGGVKIKESHRYFGKCDCQMTSIRHATRKGRKPGGRTILTADKTQYSANAYELSRSISSVRLKSE